MCFENPTLFQFNLLHAKPIINCSKVSNEIPPSNDPTRYRQYTGEIMKLYSFSGDRKYRDGETKFICNICDGACTILDGEIKIQGGNIRNTAWGVLRLRFEGKQTFLMGHSLPWRGSASAGSLLGVWPGFIHDFDRLKHRSVRQGLKGWQSLWSGRFFSFPALFDHYWLF